MTANEIKFKDIRDMYLVAFYHANGYDCDYEITYNHGWVTLEKIGQKTKCRLSQFEEMLNTLLLRFKAEPNLHL